MRKKHRNKKQNNNENNRVKYTLFTMQWGMYNSIYFDQQWRATSTITLCGRLGETSRDRKPDAPPRSAAAMSVEILITEPMTERTHGGASGGQFYVEIPDPPTQFSILHDAKCQFCLEHT